MAWLAAGLALFVIITPLLLPLVYPPIHAAPDAVRAPGAEPPTRHNLRSRPAEICSASSRSEAQFEQSYGWTDRSKGARPHSDQPRDAACSPSAACRDGRRHDAHRSLAGRSDVARMDSFLASRRLAARRRCSTCCLLACCSSAPSFSDCCFPVGVRFASAIGPPIPPTAAIASARAGIGR